VPDVHIVADGIPFWLELKVAKSNKVNISPHQVAWNMAYWARGGANFFLVKAPSIKQIILFDADQGPRLVSHGLIGAEGQSFSNVKSMLEALRPHAARILDRNHALRPHARLSPREATEERGSRAY